MKNLIQIKKAASILKPKSTVLPIIECVLIMGNRLTITDLNTSIIFKDIGIDFDFVQDAKEFINVHTFINNPILKKDGEKLSVTGNDESLTYRCEDIGNFPKITFDDVVSIGTLGANDCSRIKRALTVISKDELRPAMCAVAIKDGYIMATDAHSAIFEKSDFAYSKQILIGKKCADLMSIWSKSGYAVSLSDSRLVLENEDVIIIQRIDDNNFPDLLAILPKESPIEMIAEKKDIEIAVKKALSCASSINNIIVFNVNGQLSLSSEDTMRDRSYKRQMSCTHTGENIEIGFNAKMLLKLIDTIKVPELILKMTSSNKLCIINDSSLLMPVMLSR